MTRTWRRGGRGGAALLALLWLSAVPAVAQSQAPRGNTAGAPATPSDDPAAAPLFRSSVELVPVDVSVVDREGNPIGDLGVDDFQLEIDGRRRTIRSVEFIQQKSTPEQRRSGLAQPYSSNDASEVGRLIMLVIDEQSFAQGEAQTVLRTARQFIDRLQPSDQLALVAFPGTGPIVDFTTNHKVVREALGRVSGKAEQLDLDLDLGLTEAISIDRNELGALQAVVQRECAAGLDSVCVERVERQARIVAHYHGLQARTSLTALRGIVNSLRRVDGTKNVVLLTGGLVSTDVQLDIRDLGSTALAAQVSFYVLHLDLPRLDASRARPSPTQSADEQMRRQGLETLAGTGRGALFRAMGNGDYAFNRVLRELSGYYLLTFEPDARERDGKRHRIKVDVGRRGVTLRARSEFVTEVDVEVKSNAERLRELLGAPLISSKLPMRVTTYTYQETRGSRLRTYVCATLDAAASESMPAMVGYSIINEKGRVVAHATEQVSANLFVASVLLEPGDYRVKLAAVDGEGHPGSVEHRFSAEVTSAGPLRVGDLMLAEAGERPGQFPRPSVDQPRSGLAIGYLEFYADQRQTLANTTVTFEVADSPDGEALLASTDAGLGISGRRRAAQAVLQVRLLPPGEYVLRARLSNGDRNVRTVQRPFHVTREGALSLVANSGDAQRLRPDYRPFDKSRPLSQEVVSYFLDQLEMFPSASSRSLGESVALARQGRFADAANKSSGGETSQKMVSAFMRGLDQYQKGAYDKAINEFQASVGLVSDFFPALVYIGASLAAAGRDGDAVAAWQTSLSIDNEVAPTFPMLADALVRLNDGEQAAAILQEAHELWPDEVQYEGMLAQAYAMMGKQDESYEMALSYLEKRPDDLDAEFLVMRLLFEAYMDGRSFDSTAEDRQRLKEHASAYMSAGGPQAPIVTKWLSFLEKEVGSQP